MILLTGRTNLEPVQKKILSFVFIEKDGHQYTRLGIIQGVPNEPAIRIVKSIELSFMTGKESK